METSIVFPFDKNLPDSRDLEGAHPFSTFNSVTERRHDVYAIVAMGRNGEIGFRGDMPWHLPEDLRHFKTLTMGHPVIMGRPTWESLPKKPLPGRLNIVLSRREDFKAKGAAVATSIADAMKLSPAPEVPFIIGGGKVYAEAMPLLTRVYVTRIDADFPGADTFFPMLCEKDWKLTDVSEPLISKCGLTYRFETYESRNNQ